MLFRSFLLNPTKGFGKKYKKLTKNNKKLTEILIQKISDLSEDPLLPSLLSHKVTTPKFGECFSSRVTGDIRIIWRYDSYNQLEILELLDLGGHDEVY